MVASFSVVKDYHLVANPASKMKKNSKLARCSKSFLFNCPSSLLKRGSSGWLKFTFLFGSGAVENIHALMDMTPKNDYYCVAFHINKTRITKGMQAKVEYHLVA